jgi:hypothetical protein
MDGLPAGKHSVYVPQSLPAMGCPIAYNIPQFPSPMQQFDPPLLIGPLPADRSDVSDLTNATGFTIAPKQEDGLDPDPRLHHFTSWAP